MSTLFGALFQLGHVVPELEPAMRRWQTAGVREWDVHRDFPVAEWRYHERLKRIPVDVALAWSGGVQIELIAPRDLSPSMYQEFLAREPDGGLQHLGYRCQDYAAALAAGQAQGWRIWLSGRLENGRAFCYLRPPPAATVMLAAEISEPPFS